MNMKAFDNTATSVAASQMRNALNKLSDTVEDPATKKVSSLLSRDVFMDLGERDLKRILN